MRLVRVGVKMWNPSQQKISKNPNKGHYKDDISCITRDFRFIEPKWKWLSKRTTKTCYPNTLKGWWDCGWATLLLSSFNFFMSCQVSKFAYFHSIYKLDCLYFFACSCLRVIMPLFISFNFDESDDFDAIQTMFSVQSRKFRSF